MRRTKTLRRAGAALALPLALSLAACGGDDDAKSGAGEDSSSVDSSAAPDAKGSATPGGSTGPDGDSSDASSPGAPVVAGAKPGDSITAKQFGKLLAAAFEKATTAEVEMTSKAKDSTTTFSGDIDFTGEEPELALTMVGGAMPSGQKGDLRLVDGALYLKTGMSGDKFIKIPASDVAGAGLDLSALDPSKTVDMFAQAATSVKYVGEEEVDGDALQHYALQLDPSKMNLNKAVLSQYPKSIDYDVWFDADGRVRTIDMTIGKLGSTSVTYEDWGDPVSISAPSADDVIERPDMPDSPEQG